MPPSNQTSAQVSTFYNQFPFPLDAEVCAETYLLDLLNFWGRYDAQTRLPQNLDVLIAGCGTNQALNVALSLPDAHITAIDLSETSLAISAKMAAELGIKNITFKQADILALPELGKFDFITSFGVLHHLSDPVQGLKNLKNLLKPNGLIELMLYSETHRYFISRIQRIVTLLAGADQSHDHRLKVAKEFITSANPNSWPYGVYLKIAGVQNLAQTNLPAFCDTYIHPSEVSYTYPELLKYLALGEVQLVNFLNPDEWNVELNIYNNDFLEKQFAQLSTNARLELVDMLNGPLYMFYARPTDARLANDPLTDESFFRTVTPKQNKICYHHFDANQKLTETIDAKIEITPNALQTEFVDVKFYTHKLTDNRLLRDLIPLCDGTQTGEAITNALAQKYKATPQTVWPLVQHLLKRLLQAKMLVP